MRISVAEIETCLDQVLDESNENNLSNQIFQEEKILTDACFTMPFLGEFLLGDTLVYQAPHKINDFLNQYLANFTTKDNQCLDFRHPQCCCIHGKLKVIFSI